MRKQVVTLENDADVLAQGSKIDIRKINPVPADHDFAAVDLFETIDAAQGRALAGAGTADDGQDLAAFDGEADAIEHPERAKAFLNVAKRHDRYGGIGVLLHVRPERGWPCCVPCAVPAFG